MRQSEAANSKVAKDTIVTLEVSDGPAPTEAPTGSADHRADGAGADDGIL